MWAREGTQRPSAHLGELPRLNQLFGTRTEEVGVGFLQAWFSWVWVTEAEGLQGESVS